MEASVISDQKYKSDQKSKSNHKSSDAKQVNIAIEENQKATNDFKESKSDQKSSDAKQVNVAIEENQKTTNDFKESKSDQKSKQIAKKAKVETTVIATSITLKTHVHIVQV